MFRGRLSEHDKNLDYTRLTNASKNPDNQIDALQKQIQSYTQKFEQEKRKLFRAQQNHRQIIKDYQNQISNLESCKNLKQITGLQTKIKCLEINLQKGIAAYDQALSKNNILKNEIDQLRKDKKNQKQAFRMLTYKIEELNSSIKQLDSSIAIKKSRIQKTKQQIIQVCDKNQTQNNQYLKYIQKLKDDQKQIRQNMKNTISKQTTQASDTTPIVKLRIRNLIMENKQKIRVAELYKKSMEKIQQSFEEIKKQSGINDLEEVTNTFLKQEEQNKMIFQYIHKLTTELEMIRQDNQKLQQKISNFQQIVNQHRYQIEGTPQQQQEKAKIQKIYVQKHRYIQKLNNFLKAVQPSIIKIFKLYKKQDQNIVSHSNIQYYLAALQQMINQKFFKQVQHTVYTEIKQDFTKYCKLAPNISTDDIRDKNEDLMLEQLKFRDYASEFWQKKRLNK